MILSNPSILSVPCSAAQFSQNARLFMNTAPLAEQNVIFSGCVIYGGTKRRLCALFPSRLAPCSSCSASGGESYRNTWRDGRDEDVIETAGIGHWQGLDLGGATACFYLNFFMHTCFALLYTCEPHPTACILCSGDICARTRRLLLAAIALITSTRTRVGRVAVAIVIV